MAVLSRCMPYTIAVDANDRRFRRRGTLFVPISVYQAEPLITRQHAKLKAPCYQLDDQYIISLNTLIYCLVITFHHRGHAYGRAANGKSRPMGGVLRDRGAGFAFTVGVFSCALLRCRICHRLGQIQEGISPSCRRADIIPSVHTRRA